MALPRIQPNAAMAPPRLSVIACDGDGSMPQRYAYSRYSDRPLSWRTRLAGIGSTAGVVMVMLACMLLTWHVAAPQVAAPDPLVVNLLPLAAPPEPQQHVPEGKPQPEQQKRKPSEQERPPPPAIILPQPMQPAPQPSPMIDAAKAAERTTEASAPKAIVAPPAPRAASDAVATWEARLLAHLEKFRRYPAAARSRRLQGVVHVRFQMNREGKVLAVEVIRSSGAVALDRAALDTIRRAAPLPAIPEGRSETMILSVPVEFFVR